MQGIVVFWPGAIEDIPAGWHLCDGTEGTPDYRNVYLVGAGDLYNPGDSFGSNTQVHDFTCDGHAHPKLGPLIHMAGTDHADRAGVGYAVGTTDPADNRPQSKAGCWIMKL